MMTQATEPREDIKAELQSQLQVQQQLPFYFAKQHGVFVSSMSDDSVTLIHKPHINPIILIELRRYWQKPLILNPVADEDFEGQCTAVFSDAMANTAEDAQSAMSQMAESVDLSQLVEALPKAQDLLDSADEAPIIQLINAMITQAITQQASDIHFEVYQDRLMVRCRVDGLLRDLLQPPRALAALLISRLKVMAQLDIAEKRLPQDGRIAIKIADRDIDIRVSTMPTHYGERVVLRLLDKQAAPLDLARLGLSAHDVELMQVLIQRPHGVLLVTGPTGSGKTTTLYAILNALNHYTRNILTVEDPIEYDLSGIGQTQVNPKVNMTFARGLRAILRQDPDVVMVGEIRDRETVAMAIQASLTGHLVLSTLHTNTAIGAIARLRDMGGESFLLSSTLAGVIAQRLIRLLCSQCKVAYSASMQEKQQLGKPSSEQLTLYQANGCDICGDSGYRGRTGIYEILCIDDQLKQMIHDEASEAEMRAHIHQHGHSIHVDGWRRVLAGDTTITEVLRVVTGD